LISSISHLLREFKAFGVRHDLAQPEPLQTFADGLSLERIQ